MKLPQKVTRAAAAATTEDILQSDPKRVASGKEEKEEDENLESKKREKAIAEWNGRTFKPPLSNEDEEDKEKEEDFGAPIASTENVSPGDKDNKVHKDNWEDFSTYDSKYAVLYNAKDNEEEASLGHEGESPL